MKTQTKIVAFPILEASLQALFLTLLVALFFGQGARAQTTINDDDNSIIYSCINSTVGSKWNYQTAVSGDYSSDEHYNNNNSGQTAAESTFIQGPIVVMNFNGTSATLYGKTGPNFGIGQYSVDNGTWTSFDAYHSTVLQQQQLATTGTLTAGPHVFAYQLTRTKNASSTDYYQVIDKYQVTGTVLPYSSATTGYWNHGMVFTGSGWSHGNYTTNLSGSHSWDGTSGDTVSWTFTGNLIEIFGRPDTGDGLCDIYIDNTRVAQNVDFHYGTKDNDALTAYMVWSKVLATNASHTIKVVVNGTHDSWNGSEDSGLQNLIQIDEFAAWSVSTSGSAPATPAGLTATSGNTTVTLNWGTSVGATSYSVYRGTTSNGESGTAIASGLTSPTYLDTGRLNGTTYYYKVTATNSNGTSGFSNEASATPSVGLLSGSVGSAASSYNLTALGTVDWAHWNGTYIHSSAGGSKISNVAAFGAGTTGTFTATSRNMTWTNGTPTPTGTNDHGYIWCNGTANTGWTFTVPADTTSRTLHVMCGGPGTGASVKITAHLSDGSATDYIDTKTGSAVFLNEYTLIYKAATASQTMTITVTHTNSGSPSCDLDAAYLTN